MFTLLWLKNISDKSLNFRGHSDVYLFRFFICQYRVSWYIVFNFPRLDLVLSNVWLRGWIRISGMKHPLKRRQHEWNYNFNLQIIILLILMIVAWWCVSLPINTLVFNNVIWIVVCFGFTRISIGFIRNSWRKLETEKRRKQTFSN